MKKTLLGILLAIAIAATGAFLLAGCKEEGEQQKPGQLAYTVTVQSIGGVPLSGVSVTLYDGDTAVGTKETDDNGFVNYYMYPGEYSVAVEGYPKGYTMVENQTLTMSTDAAPLTVQFQSTLIKEEYPYGQRFNVGDIMYDFSVTLADGTVFSLSKELETKKMVLVNFWGTWCSACLREFPYMESAYQDFKDDVSIIALSDKDTEQEVINFQTQYGYTFPMAPDVNMTDPTKTSISQSFINGFYPTSVVIDRYGVVALIHESAILSKGEFVQLFEKYTSDDYVSVGPGNSGGDDETYEEDTTPDVSFAGNEAVAAAVNNGAIDITYSAEEGDVYWPWVVSDDGKSIYAANQTHGDRLLCSTSAILYFEITVNAGDVLTFDYKVSTEKDCDILYLIVDNAIIQSYSGTESGTSYGYVFERAGTYNGAFVYVKDYSTVEGEDLAQIGNIRISSTDDIDQTTYVKRYAARYLNTNYGLEGEKQYELYITPVFNEKDGYYHVNKKDGPILFADLYYGTPWAQNVSLYQLAYSGYMYFYGYDYGETMIGTYAYLCSASLNGYTPVTKELKFMIDMICYEYGAAYYEDAWLEFCLYYEYYGPSEEPIEYGDPTKGMAPHCAYDIYEGVNDVAFDKYVRLFYSKFVPEQSGVYIIQSIGARTQNINGYLMDDRGNILDSSSYTLLFDENGIPTTDDNFYLVADLQAGQTYYLVCGFGMQGELATVQVKITYDPDYRYLAPAAQGPHTVDENYQIVLVGAIDVALDEEGYYRELRADGTLGSYVYVNFLCTTNIVTSHSLQQLIDVESTNYNFNLSNFVALDGTPYPDYTEIMRKYCALAVNNTEQPEAPAGCVRATEELATILNLWSYLGDHTFKCDDNWLWLSYYYKTNSPTDEAAEDAQAPAEETESAEA